MLTLASFFFETNIIKTSLFFNFSTFFSKKSEVFLKIFMKKKLASVSSKKQSCLFLAADTCQFFFEPNSTKTFIFFQFFSKKSEVFLQIFIKKKTGKCQ